MRPTAIAIVMTLATFCSLAAADHYYTDHINDRSKPGGNLCVLNLRDGKVTELTPELKGGWFGRFDVSYWGRRNARFKNHPNFRPAVTFQQAISTTPPKFKSKR